MSKSDDPTWRLFHKRYKVRVPAYALVSEAEAALIGTFTSGDPDLDRQMKNAWTVVNITPVGICEFYIDGIPIQIINTKEAADIYHDISTHLERWSDIINNRYNIPHKPPIRDLEDFAALAEVLEPFCHVGQEKRAQAQLGRARRGANIRLSAQEYLSSRRNLDRDKYAKVKVSGMRLAKNKPEEDFSGLLSSESVKAINNRNK